MSKAISPSLEHDALYAKSQVYIGRGFRAKNAGDNEEYQLWASLALELLGKATLAHVHPVLVADPNHYQSLFAACGRPLSVDVRTITAKTLFGRIAHLDKSFDKRHQKFCEHISIRRNAELHSGESPFSGMLAEGWEPEYWNTVKCILEIHDDTLEAWLGADESTMPAEIAGKYTEALEWAVKDRIARHREEFEKSHQNPKERERVLKLSKDLVWPGIRGLFREHPDGHASAICPACGATAFLGGVLWGEEITHVEPPTEPGDTPAEHVLKIFTTEEFVCATCDLQLFGMNEILAADLEEEFQYEEVRELEFEPEYGND